MVNSWTVVKVWYQGNNKSTTCLKKTNCPSLVRRVFFEVIKIYNKNPTPLCDSVNIQEKKIV